MSRKSRGTRQSPLGRFQAMFDFYVDGFLWKMRRPLVRANV